MKFIFKTIFFISLPIFALPAVGLINNYQQTIAIQWWKACLGPLAWFVVKYSGKGNNGLVWGLLALLCFVPIVQAIRGNHIVWKVISVISIAIWFLLGLSAVLTWT